MYNYIKHYLIMINTNSIKGFKLSQNTLDGCII